jgi:hypothetical protein
MQRWAGSWHDSFDVATADLLRQTVGAVPSTVRLLLDLAADGVKLTPGGRLPRTLVRQVQESDASWSPAGRPASIEEDLPPLAVLNDLLRDVGLLRLRKGVLAPTRAAGDDIEVIRRVRSWFGPEHGFTSILVGHALASLAAHGPRTPQDLATRLFDLLGDRWVTSQGQALVVARTRSELYGVERVMVGLDLIPSSQGVWVAGPSARWLLPRATALAHLWLS